MCDIGLYKYKEPDLKTFKDIKKRANSFRLYSIRDAQCSLIKTAQKKNKEKNILCLLPLY